MTSDVSAFSESFLPVVHHRRNRPPQHGRNGVMQRGPSRQMLPAVCFGFPAKRFCFTVSNRVLRKLRSLVRRGNEMFGSRSRRRSTNAGLSIARKERLREMIALRIYSVIFSSVFGGRKSFEMAEYGLLELVFRVSH